MITEHQTIRLDGFWRIKEASAFKFEHNKDFVDEAYIAHTKSREGEILVFPYETKVGERLYGVYIATSGSNRAGKMLSTSPIKEIHRHQGSEEIQISTMNTQYVLIKWM